MPNAIYTLLDSITKRSLAMFGLEIRRLQSVIQNDVLIATTEEASRIHSRYKDFYDLFPAFSHWPHTIKEAREYMSLERIDSYYRFLRLCEEEISLDGKTIIDVGCCLGGLLDILSTRHQNTKLPNLCVQLLQSSYIIFAKKVLIILILFFVTRFLNTW